MATTLYLLGTVPDTHLGTDNLNLLGTYSTGAWQPLALGTARGSGVVAGSPTSTVTGPTAGIVALASTARLAEWISPPVAADVTISGTITGNVWASEVNMSANVAINVVIQIIRANTTTTRDSNTLEEIVRSTNAVEVAVTTRAATNFTSGMTSGAYSSQTLNRGDRLRVLVFGDDVGTMASTYNFTVSYGGSSAAADGDSYVTFTENITFESAPGGSTVYLTNTQSGLTGAPALVSSFTGSDENPLSEGGNWAALNTAVANTGLRRLSNAVASQSVGACFSYWTPANFGPDLEAYCARGSGATTAFGVAFRIQGEGGSNTWDGYVASANSGASTASITRYDNSVATSLASVGRAWASGDKVGVRCEGSTLQLWRQASGSSEWDLLLSAVDATYGSAGKIGVYVNGTAANIDDFYAATDSNLFTQQAWTSRGSGVVSYVSDTATGWTAPLLTNEWFTPPLTAFTLTGMAQANIRALESNALANASLRAEVARVEGDGSSPTVWCSWCCAPTGTDNGELTTSEVARTINLSGDDLAITNGQRLRIRLYNEDMSSAAMADTYNVQRFFNGTSGGASGDSFITFPQTLTEYASGPYVYTKAGYGIESG